MFILGSGRFHLVLFLKKLGLDILSVEGYLIYVRRVISLIPITVYVCNSAGRACAEAQHAKNML